MREWLFVASQSIANSRRKKNPLLMEQTKFVTKRTKNVGEGKSRSKRHHHYLMSFLLHFTYICGLFRLGMGLYGLYMVL